MGKPTQTSVYQLNGLISAIKTADAFRNRRNAVCELGPALRLLPLPSATLIAEIFLSGGQNFVDAFAPQLTA